MRDFKRRLLLSILVIQTSFLRGALSKSHKSFTDLPSTTSKLSNSIRKSPWTIRSGDTITHPSLTENDVHVLAVEDPGTVPVEKQNPPRKILSNASVRVLSAVALVAGVTLIITQLGDIGFVGLVLFCQVAMYREATSVMGVHRLDKWLWLSGVQSFSSLRAMVHNGFSNLDLSIVDRISYMISICSLVMSVFRMALPSNSSPALYKSYLSDLASCLLAGLLLVVQSTFWIFTLKEFGMEWIIYPALLVIINDTMAYVCGRLAGKHPILPRLSPKKTIEGFIGAAISTIVISYPLLQLILKKKAGSTATIQDAMMLSLFVSFIAPFGGFMASALKRANSAKDFGTLIPGHGGVVDRLDCQVVAAPFVYFYLKKVYLS